MLFAYIFLVGPENFQSLASAEIQYSALSTATWGQSGTGCTYVYDPNGSLAYKIHEKVLNPPAWPTEPSQSHDTYEYDLRGQLSAFTPAGGQRIEYRYNPAGIRVSQKVGTAETKYLIDPYNHTGYAQVLEETQTNVSDPANPVPISRIHYTVGDDIVGQTKATWVSATSSWDADGDNNGQDDTEYLLYDGHGSTRQLTRPDKSVIDNFSFDGYGVMLGSSAVPNPAQTAATKYLYAGEQYDKSLSHYYLRARYYNSSNGRFNQTDPFAGNPSDPQSLHKYLYAHCNPVNYIDPSGEMALASTMFRVGIGLLLTSAFLAGIHGAHKRAISVAAKMNRSSVFNAVFSGAFSWNDWKQVILGFKSGTEIGMINVMDRITFRLISPLSEYRDALWQQEGLDESWVGSAASIFAWAGTASLYAAAAIWTWSAMGGGTMDIAVQYTGEPGLYFHVQYGSNGLWQEALGNVGRMPLLPVDAGSVEGATLTGIPVLYPKAVMTSGYAYNCVVAAIRAFGRGWGLKQSK